MNDNIQKEINREVLQTVDNPLPIDKSDKRKLVAILSKVQRLSKSRLNQNL